MIRHIDRGTWTHAADHARGGPALRGAARDDRGNAKSAAFPQPVAMETFENELVDMVTRYLRGPSA
ncbi:hypothetical protein AB0M48_35875 [Lentzea sp. NPDC051208]|uniref:hypothetical protein n=1 Tax=Lentzea sp. NPDC051208 TaxID=3154642 RepID=UPI00344171DB